MDVHAGKHNFTQCADYANTLNCVWCIEGISTAEWPIILIG